MRTRKGEGKAELETRVERELPKMAAEYADTILNAVRDGTCRGVTLEAYAALRRQEIQHYCKWAGKAEAYWSHWDRRLCPAVGEMDLLQCADGTAVEEKIEEMTHRRQSKRGYTDEERTDWIVLGDLLEYACRGDGLLRDNPLRAKARQCRQKLSSVASRDLARRDLTEEEVAVLLEQCLAGRGTDVCDAMILQLLTGLTVEELCGLNVGDWQRGGTVTWLEITKAYRQGRGEAPVMTKLLDEANRYRKVVCTAVVEQHLRHIVSLRPKKSRGDRSAPLLAAPDGVRLSPQSYKAAVRETLEGIIQSGARLPFGERGAVLRGEDRPSMSHTDLLRNTAAYYFRTVCRCSHAERAALLGLCQKHTFASSYVDWGNELVLQYLRGKLERWHENVLCIGTKAEDMGTGKRGVLLQVRAEPGARLTVRAPNGVTGTITRKGEEQ